MKRIVAMLMVALWSVASVFYLRTPLAYSLFIWWNDNVTRKAYIPNSEVDSQWWEPFALYVGVVLPFLPCIVLAIVLGIAYHQIASRMDSVRDSQPTI